MATQLTSKGQVTIPKAVREYLGLKPGTAVTFERLASGEVVLRPTGGRVQRCTSWFMKLRGWVIVCMKTEEILVLMCG